LAGSRLLQGLHLSATGNGVAPLAKLEGRHRHRAGTSSVQRCSVPTTASPPTSRW
jgi:hypothetical protein